MTAAMRTSETLNLAADLIEERGWTQGSGWPAVGRAVPSVCLEGALMAAAGITLPAPRGDAANQTIDHFQITCPAYSAVARYLQRDHSPSPDGHGVTKPLWWWNDVSNRTAAEVIEVLRAAALVEAAREDEARESATEHAPALAEAVAAS